MQVYGPCWFAIKKAQKFTSGPALRFQQMTLIKTQTEDIQKLARPAVQRNAFMAEPGIMLCAMLESSSHSISRNYHENQIQASKETKKEGSERYQILAGEGA